MDRNYAKKKALYEKIMAPVAKTLMETLKKKGIKEEIDALPNVDDMPNIEDEDEYDDEVIPDNPDEDEEIDDVEDTDEAPASPKKSSKESSSVTIKFDGDFEDMLKTAEGKKIMAMLEPMEYEDLEEVALILNSKSARAQEREDFINALVTLSKYLYEKKRLEKVYESRSMRPSKNSRRMRRLYEEDDYRQRGRLAPRTKEELLQIIIDRIQAEDPSCDLNDIDVSGITDMSCLFDAYENRIFRDFNGDISLWDVSNVKNMKGMFYNCEYFNSDLSSWDVSNVTNMNSMFFGCKRFNSDLSEWDVSNVFDMSWMFYNCKCFNSYMPYWDVSNVESMRRMFYGCISMSEDNFPDWYQEESPRRRGRLNERKLPRLRSLKEEKSCKNCKNCTCKNGKCECDDDLDECGDDLDECGIDECGNDSRLSLYEAKRERSRRMKEMIRRRESLRRRR